MIQYMKLFSISYLSSIIILVIPLFLVGLGLWEFNYYQDKIIYAIGMSFPVAIIIAYLISDEFIGGSSE